VKYANLPPHGVLGVIGLGPVGQFVSRIGVHLGHRVVAVDPVPERREMAERHGVDTFDLDDDVAAWFREATDGRGPDAVVDAVGMEAHGNPATALTQSAVGLLPDAVAKKVMTTAGVDRMAALNLAVDAVRRGGTISLSGVYAGVADPMPLMTMFDKQVSLRMGQCNVHAWREELLPLVEDPADPLGTEDLVTHHASIEDAPAMYDLFRDKQDGCVKVVLHP
jgi:threonine dehydrogenase-like Zn-dependent dehydrogenase